jgi:hypothetical protein
METQSRLPRMMSLIAIVQQIDDAGALSLAMLRRRGFAITVIVNQVDEAYMDTAARLVAHNIPTLPLHDETSIATVCRRWMMAGQL